MFFKFRLTILLSWVISAAAIFGIISACSPEHYKADADKEVYSIIDGKWQDSFGQKANYKISDVPPSPNDVQIEQAAPPSGVISLAQAVAMATAHNRDYQNRKEDLYLAALGLTLERYKYARQWFGTIDGKYTKVADSNEEVGMEARVGFDHTLLLGDGVEISTGIALDWMRFLTGDPRTSLGSILNARLTAPLLGAGAGRAARENLTQAERSVLYQIRSFSRYRQTFVVSTVAQYYDVLQQKDVVTNAQNNYKRVTESRDRLEMEASAGRKPHFQVDQAEQSLLRARDNYVQTQQQYKQKLDEFKIFLSLPTDADIELDQNELKALEEMGISAPAYAPEAAIETALLQRLDLANSADAIDDALRKTLLAADGLGTQLDLTGTAEVGSAEKTDFTRLQFQNGSYALGLEADLPLDRKAQRNAYRQGLITLQRQQRRYDDDMDRVKLDVRQAYRQLQEAAERYHIQKISLELAQKRVESTSMLLDAGRVETRELLESQDALLEAQNNLTAALVAHAVAKLNFFQSIGILEIKPDGMWEQQVQ